MLRSIHKFPTPWNTTEYNPAWTSLKRSASVSHVEQFRSSYKPPLQSSSHLVTRHERNTIARRQSWDLPLTAEMACVCVCSSSIRTRSTIARRAWVVRRVHAEASRRRGRPDAAAGLAAAAASAAAAVAWGPDKDASRPTGARPPTHGRATRSSGTACCSLWSTRSIHSTTVSPAPVYQLHTLSLSLAACAFLLARWLLVSLTPVLCRSMCRARACSASLSCALIVPFRAPWYRALTSSWYHIRPEVLDKMDVAISRQFHKSLIRSIKLI